MSKVQIKNYEATAFNLHLDGKSICFALVSKFRNGRQIVRLKTDKKHRCEGYATQLLEAIIAKYGNQDLFLIPEPFDDMPMTRTMLELWYEEFGFFPDGDPDIFRRVATKPVKI